MQRGSEINLPNSGGGGGGGGGTVHIVVVQTQYQHIIQRTELRLHFVNLFTNTGLGSRTTRNLNVLVP